MAMHEKTREVLELHRKVETSRVRVGMLRQWLNEDRIKDGKNFVTNEEILFWLTGDKQFLTQK